MADTAITLRTELNRARPARRNLGYPPDLRKRVGRWIVRRRAEGVGVKPLAKETGISTNSVRVWARAVEAPDGAETGGFLPVKIAQMDVPDEDVDGPTLHTRDGYRVTGLHIEDIITVLRGLE